MFRASSVFHEDDRYVRSGSGDKFGTRTGMAMDFEVAVEFWPLMLSLLVKEERRLYAAILTFSRGCSRPGANRWPLARF